MSNLPATTTKAVSDLRSAMMTDAMKKEITMALPKILPMDRFLRSFFTTVNKIPDIALCDRNSVYAGVMTAASLGLEIDPVLGRFYLIPFKDKDKGLVATSIVGYKGYIDLYYRSGLGAGFLAEAVYEKDHFEYELGLDPKLIHKPCDDEDRGALKYAYAVATLTNGGKVWRVVNRAAVMRAKSKSRGANSSFSPWNTFEDTMWIKTAIRSIHSRIPLSPELRDAISRDEESDLASAIDVQGTVTATTPNEQKSAGAVTPPGPELPLRAKVNTLMVDAGREMGSEKTQALIDGVAGQGKAISGLDEVTLQKLHDVLSTELRMAMEAGGAQ